MILKILPLQLEEEIELNNITIEIKFVVSWKFYLF